MIRTIISKETSQTAVVAGSKSDKWGYLNITWVNPASISGVRLECMKNQISERAKHSDKKNLRNLCRGINETNLLKDENVDLHAESHSTLNSWKNYFFQLLNVHRASDVRQVEIHTAEPLVLYLKVEIPVAKLKRYKS
jgi:hypothetical protein